MSVGYDSQKRQVSHSNVVEAPHVYAMLSSWLFPFLFMYFILSLQTGEKYQHMNNATRVADRGACRLLWITCQRIYTKTFVKVLMKTSDWATLVLAARLSGAFAKILHQQRKRALGCHLQSIPQSSFRLPNLEMLWPALWEVFFHLSSHQRNFSSAFCHYTTFAGESWEGLWSRTKWRNMLLSLSMGPGRFVKQHWQDFTQICQNQACDSLQLHTAFIGWWYSMPILSALKLSEVKAKA